MAKIPTNELVEQLRIQGFFVVPYDLLKTYPVLASFFVDLQKIAVNGRIVASNKDLKDLGLAGGVTSIDMNLKQLSKLGYVYLHRLPKSGRTAPMGQRRIAKYNPAVHRTIFLLYRFNEGRDIIVHETGKEELKEGLVYMKKQANAYVINHYYMPKNQDKMIPEIMDEARPKEKIKPIDSLDHRNV